MRCSLFRGATTASRNLGLSRRSLLSGTRPLRPFKVERHPGWDTAPFLLSCADCEPLQLQELLSMAEAESEAHAVKSLDLWENLNLGYTYQQGLPLLREEILGSEFLTDGGSEPAARGSMSPDDITVAAPAEGIWLAMTALFEYFQLTNNGAANPAIHVIATAPSYQSLTEMAYALRPICKLSLWKPEKSSLDNEPRFSVDELERLLAGTSPEREDGSPESTTCSTAAFQLLVMNFPHNPTGALLSRADLDRVISMCREHRAFISGAARRGPGARAAAGPRRGAPGRGPERAGRRPIRRGGVACPASARRGRRVREGDLPRRAIQKRVHELKDYTTICPSAPSEVLALMGLRAGGKIAGRNLGIIGNNLETMERCFGGGSSTGKFVWARPTAGSFAFPRLVGSSSGSDGDSAAASDTDRYCADLERNHGIMLLPSSYFDEDVRDRFRITFGRKDTADILEKHWALF
ncbi:unnamed protein product [Prorocentrum cordatum]|uniref:Aminotransferase class I/classII large domain-containing protein n=1 Tax=Prorocentrum cordatum TaxID=2364126 RepID=A0ABN9UHG8_9DINO|nr:unnamed protein product [Polarella glacialis]